ncbi:MAG: hypothetical protein QOH06_5518 [Acidobacteriota bacterium]|jgi:FxsC-like protein|nr:hypothetical protein [Acidobacteriota bacterium]
MSYHYFLSYARLDRDNDPHRCIPRFFEELDLELRRKLKLKQKEPAGFFDGEGIEPGELWPETLGAALQSCCALVCLYSPAYFDSEYCGKEWAVFESRLAPVRAPLVIPVLFDPPQDLGTLPEGLADVQYNHDDYPEIYREEGLKYLMVRNSPELKDAYQNFLEALVHRLMDRLAKQKLAPLANLPNIKTVQSRFHPCRHAAADGVAAQNRPASIGSGPRHADFVYVAARRDEVSGIKKDVEGYGEDDELEWQPFWPPLRKEAALLAQEVATREGFRYQALPLSDQLDAQVQDSLSKSRIVILLADAWTLRLRRYQEIVRRFDGLDSWNSAVTIAWNSGDQDTAREKPQLEQAIRASFIVKSRRDKGQYFFNASNADELEKSLSVLLQRLKVEIIEISRDLRSIPSDIGKPEILTPAGGDVT